VTGGRCTRRSRRSPERPPSGPPGWAGRTRRNARRYPRRASRWPGRRRPARRDRAGHERGRDALDRLRRPLPDPLAERQVRPGLWRRREPGQLRGELLPSSLEESAHLGLPVSGRGIHPDHGRWRPICHSVSAFQCVPACIEAAGSGSLRPSRRSGAPQGEPSRIDREGSGPSGSLPSRFPPSVCGQFIPLNPGRRRS
jgi:hypothetical protein